MMHGTDQALAISEAEPLELGSEAENGETADALLSAIIAHARSIAARAEEIRRQLIQKTSPEAAALVDERCRSVLSIAPALLDLTLHHLQSMQNLIEALDYRDSEAA